MKQDTKILNKILEKNQNQQYTKPKACFVPRECRIDVTLENLSVYNFPY